MKHICIFTGGNCPNKNSLETYFAYYGKPFYTIAADSGLESAINYGFIPDIVVGDMDSLNDISLLSKIDKNKIEEFPCDKDYSDTELALSKALEKEEENKDEKVWITLLGGGGGRVDHLFAIFDIFSSDYASLVKRPFDAWIPGNSDDEDETQALYFLPKDRSAKITDAFHSDYISVCRTSRNFSSGYVETSGLKWEGSVFRKKGMPSLSNRIADDNEEGIITMTARESDFVIILPIQAKYCLI